MEYELIVSVNFFVGHSDIWNFTCFLMFDWKNPYKSIDNVVEFRQTMVKFGMYMIRYDLEMMKCVIGDFLYEISFNAMMKDVEFRELILQSDEKKLRYIGTQSMAFGDEVCDIIVSDYEKFAIEKFSMLKKIRIDESLVLEFRNFEPDKIRYLIKFLKPYRMTVEEFAQYAIEQTIYDITDDIYRHFEIKK